MNNSHHALLGPTLLGTFLIVLPPPASADWNEVGQIIVHDQGERFMRDFPLAGPIEKLRLKADGSDIFCRSIQANFADGNASEIFEGILQRDQLSDVELPGNDRRIQSLTFLCGALTRGSAQIHIIADIDRGEWRRNPNS